MTKFHVEFSFPRTEYGKSTLHQFIYTSVESCFPYNFEFIPLFDSGIDEELIFDSGVWNSVLLIIRWKQYSSERSSISR